MFSNRALLALLGTSISIAILLLVVTGVSSKEEVPISYPKISLDRPRVVLVAGLLSKEVAPALQAALGSKVQVVRESTDELLYQPNWVYQLNKYQPDVLIAMAPSNIITCLATPCKNLKPAHKAFIKNVYKATKSRGTKVVWLSIPLPASTPDSKAYTDNKPVPGVGFDYNIPDSKSYADNGYSYENGKWINSYDKAQAVKNNGTFVSFLNQLPVSFFAKAPDGLTYQARKPDTFHFCPITASKAAEALVPYIVAQKYITPYQRWYKGDWWADSQSTTNTFNTQLSEAAQQNSSSCDLEPINAP